MYSTQCELEDRFETWQGIEESYKQHMIFLRFLSTCCVIVHIQKHYAWLLSQGADFPFFSNLLLTCRLVAELNRSSGGKYELKTEKEDPLTNHSGYLHLARPCPPPLTEFLYVKGNAQDVCKCQFPVCVSTYSAFFFLYQSMCRKCLHWLSFCVSPCIRHHILCSHTHSLSCVSSCVVTHFPCLSSNSDLHTNPSARSLLCILQYPYSLPCSHTFHLGRMSSCLDFQLIESLSSSKDVCTSMPNYSLPFLYIERLSGPEDDCSLFLIMRCLLINVLLHQIMSAHLNYVSSCLAVTNPSCQLHRSKPSS